MAKAVAKGVDEFDKSKGDPIRPWAAFKALIRLGAVAAYVKLYPEEAAGYLMSDQDDPNAYQLGYQWLLHLRPHPSLHGNGEKANEDPYSSRLFKNGSKLGDQMLQVDYVQSAIKEARLAAARGDFSAIEIVRDLGEENEIKYGMGLLIDVFGDPEDRRSVRGLHGTMVGSAQVTGSYSINNVTVTTINVRLTDVLKLSSGTRPPPSAGGYDKKNPRKIMEDNPFGRYGPMANITIEYNLTQVFVEVH
jgi:hypothetical protein